MSNKYHTKYWAITDVYENASRGDTEDVIIRKMTKDDVWEMVHRLIEYLHSGEVGDYEMVIPCKLISCDSYGREIKSECKVE